MKDLRIAGLFPDVSIEDWKDAARSALRGDDIGTLTTRTHESLNIEPLYDPALTAPIARLSGNIGASPYIRGKQPARDKPAWRIIQLIDHIDIVAARKQMREDYDNGVRAFWFQFGGVAAYGGGFVGARNLTALESLFDGIALDSIDLYITGGFDSIPTAALLTALIEKNGTPPGRISGSAGLDPISHFAATGHVPALRKCVISDVVDVATYFRESGYGWTPFVVSSRAWHNAGGSAREELGLTLAAAVFYWRGLIDAGWPLEDAADAISFSLTADADLFTTLAKLRAMRALWARVTEASGITPKRANIICEMSFRMMTERDAYVNLLRATAAAFGAGAGGADGVLLVPFNVCHGIPDAFPRRMARNIQLMLQEESGLGRVADPAGGSAYLETLTHDLARISWDLFREVEAGGGLLLALDSGLVNRKLMDRAMRRRRNIAHNREKVTGISSFPDLQEELVFSRPEDVAIDLKALDEEGIMPALPCPNRGKRFAEMVKAASSGATLKGLEDAGRRVTERVDYIPKCDKRASEAFERLRRASDRAMSRVKARPPVFLANLGALASYTASASWAANFFAAGGIEALDRGGYETLDDLIRAFQRSPAPVACICVAEAEIQRIGGVPNALKETGAAAIYLAGRAELLPSIPLADRLLIDRIIYDGCNMLAILSELHDIMNVRELGEAEPENLEDGDSAALFTHEL